MLIGDYFWNKIDAHDHLANHSIYLILAILMVLKQRFAKIRICNDYTEMDLFYQKIVLALKLPHLYGGNIPQGDTENVGQG